MSDKIIINPNDGYNIIIQTKTIDGYLQTALTIDNIENKVIIPSISIDQFTTQQQAVFNNGISVCGDGYFQDNLNVDGYIQLKDSNGTHIKIQSSEMLSDWTLTLPSDCGSDGYILKTDGTGNTSWIDVLSTIIDGGGASSF